MEIKSLCENNLSLIPDIIQLYNKEIDKLHEVDQSPGFNPKEVYRYKKSRNEEYFRNVALGESKIKLDILLDEIHGLEGTLEYKEYFDDVNDVRVLVCDILLVLVKDKGIGYGSKLLENRIDNSRKHICDLINLVVPMPSFLPLELYKNYDFRYICNRDNAFRIYCKTLTDAGKISLEK